MFSDEGLGSALKKIAEAIKDEPVKAFCYLQDHQAPIDQKLARQLPMMSFGHLPMRQVDFNRTFVIKKELERTLTNESKPSTSGAAKSGPALSLIEASSQLKET